MSASKIKSDFVIDTISERANDKAKRIIDEFGDGVKSWVWSVNWGDQDHILPPSGFSIKVSYDTSIKSSLFHPTKLFHGISVYKLDINKGDNAKKLHHKYLMDRQNELLQSMKSNITTKAKQPITLSCSSSDCSTDTKKWKSILSGGSSFIGLYSSKSRTGYLTNKDYWLVVQSEIPYISNELYQKIVTAEKSEKVNWRELFLNDHAFSFAQCASKRNRNRLLAQLARVCITSPFLSTNQKSRCN